MAKTSAAVHDHWSSRLAFILAAVGSSVGLGNFWRFPYETGENGGSAFVLIYLIAVVFVGMPILLSELFIGRRGGGSAVASVRALAKEAGASQLWAAAGWAGMISAFLVLSFYSVIAGWIISYIPLFIGGGLKGASPDAVGEAFTGLLADPARMAAYHAVFYGMTVFIVARGLKGGIELAVEILMPAFFVMLVIVTAAACVIGDAGAAAKFLLTPDFSKIDGDVVAAAVGQAFFSIGLGTAIMYAYGSYMTQDVHVPRSSLIIAASDTLVALIAGFAIFPLVFAFGLDPTAGPGLLFVTLPIAFSQMPFGMVLGAVFFFLALFAAVTSSISLLEAVTSWAEERTGLGRAPVAVGLGLLGYVVGLGSVFSFNILSDFHPLDIIPLFKGMGVLDVLDTITSRVFMPLSGLLTALFAGWVVAAHISRDELRFPGGAMFAFWRFLVRFVCPLGLAGVLVHGVFFA